MTFPFFLNGQITGFQSVVNNPWLDSFSDERTSSFIDTSRHISIGPRLLGVSSFSENRQYDSYLLGLSLSSRINKNINVISTYDYLAGNHNLIISEYFDSLGVYSGFGAENTRLQFHLTYKFNKFNTIDVGKGKHFIGNGYRSLFLSSDHSSYPYLRLTTEFGRVRYYNLYTTFLDIQDPNQNRKKHAAIHFLDFQLTSNINIGVFESVLWQANDENYNRGYDVEYLNPIIFYRPVEFSKHSPDNVLIGGNFHAKFDKVILYGQILLDDLNISRQKDRDANYAEGFFQNKFGYQLGLKYLVRDLNTLIEYNQAQPYTYAHKEPMQSYTHVNQALAHPLGANFKELVFLGNYTKDKWSFAAKLTLARVGLDSLHTHYGQNIFASDFEAQGDDQEYSYGNFNGQGVLTEIRTFHAEVIYSLKLCDVFGSVYYKKKKSDLIDQNSLWYSVGIRTALFPTFQDY